MQKHPGIIMLLHLTQQNIFAQGTETGSEFKRKGAMNLDLSAPHRKVTHLSAKALWHTDAAHKQLEHSCHPNCGSLLVLI